MTMAFRSACFRRHNFRIWYQIETILWVNLSQRLGSDVY